MQRFLPALYILSGRNRPSQVLQKVLRQLLQCYSISASIKILIIIALDFTASCSNALVVLVVNWFVRKIRHLIWDASLSPAFMSPHRAHEVNPFIFLCMYMYADDPKILPHALSTRENIGSDWTPAYTPTLIIIISQ
jgi:hypothetical protein